MATGTNQPRKARLSQPQVRIATPDETLCRYHVDLFNPATGKAKDARFEEINFDLYKPGAKSIAFTTSEVRISLWIRCFIERYYKQQNEALRATWEEQDSTGNADLCDRILLHLYALDEKKEQHVVAITVYISTGTIFIQGKWYQQYGLIEFPLLLEIINEMKELDNPDAFDPQLFNSTPLSSLLNKIVSPTTPVIGREHEQEETEKKGEGDVLTREVDINVASTPETNRPEEFLKSIADDIQSVGNSSLSYTPSRLHTITTLRTSVANMESEFVAFKMEMTQIVQSLQSTIATNDGETKDKLVQSDNTFKLRMKKIEEENKELIISNAKLMDEVQSLSLVEKKLQDQVNLLRKKDNILEEQHQVLKEDHDAMKKELESLKKCQSQQCESQQCHEATRQYPTESPEERSTSPHAMPESVMVIPSDVPLNNRFEVLRDEQEENTQISEMATAQEAVTPTNGTKNQQRKPETTSSRKNQEQRQTTTNQQRSTTYKANTVILCDSNGKYLKLKKLCPDKNTKYLRCPTINRGNEIIATLSFDSPEIILIHTGTNDLEHSGSAEHLASEISGLVTATAKQYPSTKVLYSTLLPRQDVPPEEISKINSLIEKRCSRLANVHLIDHTNLHLSQFPILHDLKHLNQAGVKLFARNLKSMIYGRRPTPLHRTGVQNATSFQGNNRFQRVHELHATPPRGQEHPKTQVHTYATAVQRPPPSVTVPTVHPAMQPLQPQTNDIQQNMEQQGHTTNISIHKKLLPLIQLLNSIV